MNDKHALGIVYWILFWLTLGLLFLIGSAIFQDFHLLGGIVLAVAMWMAAAAAWGRERDREAQAFPSDQSDQRARAFSRIRLFCRGSLLAGILLVLCVPISLLVLPVKRAIEDARLKQAAFAPRVEPLKQISIALGAYYCREKAWPDARGEALLRRVQQTGDLPMPFPAADYEASLVTCPSGVAPREVPWVWERQARPDGVPLRGVLFMDLHMDFMPELDFQTMLKKGTK